jgi:hypothetical protein
MSQEACPRCGGAGVIVITEGVYVPCECPEGERAEGHISADNRKEVDKLDD